MTVAIRLGTRGSALARWQAQWVAARLTEQGAEVTLVPIVTRGDRRQEGTIGELGDRGVFTREIQRALLDGQIDLAVHSLKDLPTDEAPGLALTAVPPRADPGDVLVSSRYASLDALPAQAVIGTGSLRRRAQLLHVRPDLVLRDIRGNVDTRLRKLDQGDYDALVLAEAGLVRLGLADRITQRLTPAVLLPAVGQGALGLETRSDDLQVRKILAKLDDPVAHAAVLAERAMLSALQGGCLAPIAAWCRLESSSAEASLLLTGRVLPPDGSRTLEVTHSGTTSDPVFLGRRVAESLLAQGAAEMVEQARG